MNCCGMRETADAYTSGLSTEPTEPAISIATPPSCRSKALRKKLIQSAEIRLFCAKPTA